MKMFQLMFLLIAGLETAVNEASDLVEGRFDPRIVPQLHRTSTLKIFVSLRTKVLLYLTKKNPFLPLSGNLRKFFLTHSFMN